MSNKRFVRFVVMLMLIAIVLSSIMTGFLIFF
ncbi:stressosome-associated protein Prli42 [Listeria sp. PSOL-1]